MITSNLPKLLRSRLSPPEICPRPPEGERAAAVLLALCRKEEAWQLLLTRRTETVAEHKGQVAFPGGAVDKVDQTRAETALREAYEEIGLRSDDVTVLGCLSPCSTITGWHVTPVVCTIPDTYPFRVNPHEIDGVFAVPLIWLADRDNLTRELYTNPHDGRKHSVFFFRPYTGQVLWGASAHMTIALLEVAGLR